MTAKTVVQEWRTATKKTDPVDHSGLERRIEEYAETRVAGLREALEAIAFNGLGLSQGEQIAREALAATPSRMRQVGWVEPIRGTIYGMELARAPYLAKPVYVMEEGEKL
jgi:hypothetical protein